LHPPLGPPTALYDAAGQRLAGVDLEALALREGETREPLRIPLTAQGRTIGELRSRIPPRRFNTPQATAFSRQQSLASLWIGLVALLVALLLSLLLARALLAPLRQVIAAVARLTEGDDPGPFTRKPADELGQLMHGIEQLARTLKANRTSRQRWLAAISHELRTPVTILHGEIELMKDGLRALDQAQLLSLDQEVNRLRHLIEDLYALSLADIGGLHYRFATLDLHDALCIALDRVRARATESGLRLRLESMSPVWIQADATRLDQLLGNLLDNALAYTDAPGEVRIRVTRDAREVTMCIDDTPPRPAVADLALLFEPLYRTAASHRRRRAGAGLGLAICRDIVTAHQGRIRACPSDLGGLCVEVTLPARSPP
jgi:two-component system sensor histidine kinase BaeS